MGGESLVCVALNVILVGVLPTSSRTFYMCTKGVPCGEVMFQHE